MRINELYKMFKEGIDAYPDTSIVYHQINQLTYRVPEKVPQHIKDEFNTNPFIEGDKDFTKLKKSLKKNMIIPFFTSPCFFIGDKVVLPPGGKHLTNGGSHRIKCFEDFIESGEMEGTVKAPCLQLINTESNPDIVLYSPIILKEHGEEEYKDNVEGLVDKYEFLSIEDGKFKYNVKSYYAFYNWMMRITWAITSHMAKSSKDLKVPKWMEYKW